MHNMPFNIILLWFWNQLQTKAVTNADSVNNTVVFRENISCHNENNILYRISISKCSKKKFEPIDVSVQNRALHVRRTSDIDTTLIVTSIPLSESSLDTSPCVNTVYRHVSSFSFVLPWWWYLVLGLLLNYCDCFLATETAKRRQASVWQTDSISRKTYNFSSVTYRYHCLDPDFKMNNVYGFLVMMCISLGEYHFTLPR